MSESGAEAARRVVEEWRNACSRYKWGTSEAEYDDLVAKLAPIFERAQAHARGAPRNDTDCPMHGRFVATICIGCHDALRERAERLREALTTFGLHRSGCPWNYTYPKDCQCGLTAALAVTERKS